MCLALILYVFWSFFSYFHSLISLISSFIGGFSIIPNRRHLSSQYIPLQIGLIYRWKCVIARGVCFYIWNHLHVFGATSLIKPLNVNGLGCSTRVPIHYMTFIWRFYLIMVMLRVSLKNWLVLPFKIHFFRVCLFVFEFVFESCVNVNFFFVF